MAMSATLKSDTVGIPVRPAMTAPSPIWTV